MLFSRTWAMPSKDTFSVKPIGEFVKRWIAGSQVSVDPFARNSKLALFTNDLNPNTEARYHMDATEFLKLMKTYGTAFDLAIFDPPYSPRQISECYKEIGKKVTQTDTQNSVMVKNARDALDEVMMPGSVVLSFGWNSVGMGIKRGYEIIEIMLCCHGGVHNDTICVAERKL
jgi:hypothetical protein